jgi:L-fuconolactonase
MLGRVTRVDAHLHLWDPERFSYPWLAAIPPLQRAFAMRDYPGLQGDDMRSVDAVVAVEANVGAGSEFDEARWLEQIARADTRLVGIVAYVDVTDPMACENAIWQLKRQQCVVGVRHNIQGHPPGYAVQSSFVRGVRILERASLPFDLCITASQLAEVTGLVDRCPEVRFVLDHFGKPDIAGDAFDEWRHGIDAIAKHQTVFCKLSGLFTEAGPGRCDADTLRPYFKHVIEAFGPRRVMYGSDWPVCTLAGSAEDWHAIVSDVVSGLCSRHERDEIFGGTAIRAYRLSITSPA